MTPAEIITASPSFGFSAVTKKLWKTFCSMKNGMEIKQILPYSMQLSSSSPEAPRKLATLGTNKAPSNEKITPNIAVTYTSMEKYSFASFFLPSPRVLPTSALPPVPIIKPSAEIAIRRGRIRLMEARAVLPT